MVPKYLVLRTAICILLLVQFHISPSQDWKDEFPELKPRQIKEDDINRVHKRFRTYDAMLKVRTHALINFSSEENFMSDMYTSDSIRTLKPNVTFTRTSRVFLKNGASWFLPSPSKPDGFNQRIKKEEYRQDTLAYQRLQFLDFVRVAALKDQFHQYVDKYVVTQDYSIDEKKAYTTTVEVGYNNENRMETRDRKLVSYLE